MAARLLQPLTSVSIHRTDGAIAGPTGIFSHSRFLSVRLVSS